MGVKDFLFGSEGTAGEAGNIVDYIDEYDDYKDYRQELIQYSKDNMAFKENENMARYDQDILNAQYAQIDKEMYGLPGHHGMSAAGVVGQSTTTGGVGQKAYVQGMERVGQEGAFQKIAAKRRSDEFKKNYMVDAQKRSTDVLLGLDRNPEYYASSYQFQPQAGSEGLVAGMAKAWAGSAGGGDYLSAIMPGGG